MKINPGIFKANDIRGIYPDDLNEDVAYLVGRAFATFFSKDRLAVNPLRVVVGRDMRLSGPVLHAAVIRGLTDQGADVMDIGMVSTDQYYYVCAETGLPGLMVTASHNPKQYNGFKMVRKIPHLLGGQTGIQDLRLLVEQEDFPQPQRQGVIHEYDFQEAFIDRLMSVINPDIIHPLKVVADTGNGMVGPLLKQVFGRLPVQLTGLYLEPDGSLPNHGLDPLQPENRAELQRKVVELGADIGLAFDGDGDRFFAIDDRGHFVPGDFLTAILAGHVLLKYPGSKVIYDLRASWAVQDSILAAGGIPLVERVGHTFIKQCMADEGAVFAGEITGHYYFKDFYSVDSGLLPALVLLELLSIHETQLSSLLTPLEDKYFISGEINSRVDDQRSRIEAIAEKYADGKQDWTDGLTVLYPTWHLNVRGSNTEPLLRLNLESIRSPEEMAARRDEVLAMIRG
jgi:phosphomannomutase